MTNRVYSPIESWIASQRSVPARSDFDVKPRFLQVRLILIICWRPSLGALVDLGTRRPCEGAEGVRLSRFTAISSQTQRLPSSLAS